MYKDKKVPSWTRHFSIPAFRFSPTFLLAVCVLLMVYAALRGTVFSPRGPRSEAHNITAFYRHMHRHGPATTVTKTKVQWSSVVLRHVKIPLDRVWGSNYVVLLAALYATEGPILELGTCYSSSPLIHNVAAEMGRYVMTVESEPALLQRFLILKNPLHDYAYVSREPASFHEYLPSPRYYQSWSGVGIDAQWGLVLIDCSPSTYRWQDILRLQNSTSAFVITDTKDQLFGKHREQEVANTFPYKFHFMNKELVNVGTDVWSMNNHHVISKIRKLVCWTVEIVVGTKGRMDESKC